MRSMILVVALTATSSAFASTYTRPTTAMHTQKPREVMVTFQNGSVQERDIEVAGTRYLIGQGQSVRVEIPVGTPVHMSSRVNSKVNEDLMQVSSNDDGKTVRLQ